MAITTPISPSLHLQMFLFVVGLTLAAVALGFLARRSGKLAGISRTLGGSLFLLWVGYNVYYFHPAIFRWDTSLPLHVCDMLGPVAAFVLITSKPYSRAVLYFSALPLAGQAILTPTGNQDPVTLRFWLYWTLHAGIIAASVFDVSVRRYRPVLRDYVRAVSAGLLYAVVIVPLDLFFDWNYGYLGRSKPDAATAIDFLGPWPQRIFVIALIVVVVQGIMLLPWLAWRKRKVQL